jgi:ferredoxin-NADP reductase
MTSIKLKPGPSWQIATVSSVHVESPRVKLFKLDFASEQAGVGFYAGQYFDVRLTAPDGYQAQRSYSVTSSPDEQGSIELAIERIEDGEVSSYFHELVEVGDKIEIRGPIGGNFTWFPALSKPVLLIGGGSGIAPLMSMLRHRKSSNSASPALLMFSARTEVDLLFRDELEGMAKDDVNFDLVMTLTRSVPEGWNGENRRIDKKMLDEAVKLIQTKEARPLGRAYVCGGSDFVETIGAHLLESGMDYSDVRTERFGP